MDYYPIRLADQLRAHLRALRKQRGLTQTQLGQRLGLGQVRIAEIEARPGSISVDQLVQILSVLGATLVLHDLGGEAAAFSPAVLAGEPAAKALAKPAAKRRAVRTPAKALVIPPKKGSW
jgi:HTH-type transcriptional regulator/antitoxin HipB